MYSRGTIKQIWRFYTYGKFDKDKLFLKHLLVQQEIDKLRRLKRS